jgi:hypothetical protein
VKDIASLALFAICLVVFCVGNCGTPDPKLKRSLESQAMTSVTVGGWDAFECSYGDTISRNFTARNAANQPVSGTVCCGFFIGGCLVRW